MSDLNIRPIPIGILIDVEQNYRQKKQGAVCVRGTSAIIISDSLEQRDVFKLHPKENYENNTRIIIRNIFCARGVIIKNVFKI